MNPFDSYVGIAFRDHGRDRDGCDCWGLLRLVMAELAGIELPSYSERYVTSADAADVAGLIEGELPPWRAIETGRELAFDAVLMREGRFARHVGLVTSPGQLLHVATSHASQIERYRHGILAHRIVGFYRFEAA